MIAAMTALLVAGCGPKRPETIPVSGRVTFGGAAPPAPGAIYFATLEPAEGFARRPGSAEFDASGNYEVKSFEGTKGLVPGTYRARVECWKVAPEMGVSPGVSHVPANFSPPELTVSIDAGSIDYDIDVPAAPAAN